MEENPNYHEGTETMLDRIRASFLDEDAEARLSESDKQRRDELVAAHGLMVGGKSLEQTVKLLCGRFDIGRTTAYRRCTECTILFADVTKTHKEGVKHILYELAMKAYQLAKKSTDKFGNPDVKGMNGAVKNMILLKGLDKEDASALTPEMLGQKNYYLTLNVGGGTGSPKAIDLTNPDRLDADTYAQVMEVVEQSDLGLAGMQLLLTEATEAGEEEDDA
jgi:hypothetical protein